MTKDASRYKDLGPLQDLLLRACPPDDKGKRSLPVLARALGVSHQYVYRWVKEAKVPQKFLGKIVALSNGRVTLGQFHPYLF